MKKSKSGILVLVVLALVLFLGIVLFIKSNPGLTRPAAASAASAGNQATPAPTPTVAPTPEPTPEVEKKTGIMNVLLLGTDERSQDFSDNARSDSILVMSLNFDEETVKLISFERGMGVPILEGTYEGQYDWLTHCFRYGGADLVLREIQECFSLDVDYYVRANFTSLVKIVDEIGGVDIELTQAEADYVNSDIGTEDDARLAEGMNHLNGQAALSFARCRKIDDDWHRMERQRKVIQACADQMKSLDEETKQNVAIRIAAAVHTNLNQKELKQSMDQLLGVAGVQMEQLVMPAEGTYGSMTGMGGRSMFAPDFEKNSELLHDFIYGEQATAETAQQG